MVTEDQLDEAARNLMRRLAALQHLMPRLAPPPEAEQHQGTACYACGQLVAEHPDILRRCDDI